MIKFFERLLRGVRRFDEEHNFTCDICGREVFGGERICERCYPFLPWNDKEICPFCGRKVGEAGACLECKAQPLKTDKARSAFVHEGEGKRLVLRFKSGKKYLVRAAAEVLFPILEREFGMADAVTFVPMAKEDEKKRGYNQSRLLAERLAAMSGKELLDVAVKQRQTAEQKSLGRREREKNLERCFHVNERRAVKGKRILIVDDTLTTGATSSELADCLKRAGAEKVFLLTITSVQKKNQFGIKPQE